MFKREAKFSNNQSCDLKWT